MLKNLESDLCRCCVIDRASPIAFFQRLMKIIFGYGLQAIAVYRYGKWVQRKFSNPRLIPIKFLFSSIYLITNWFIKKAYDIDLSLNADIGAGLLIGHFGGIEIKCGEIGKNCSIQQQVKILKDEAGNIPHIGSNVWIGAHSRISGCTIEDNATISAGTWLSKDVKQFNLAAGNPGRIIAKNYNNKDILGIIV